MWRKKKQPNPRMVCPPPKYKQGQFMWYQPTHHSIWFDQPINKPKVPCKIRNIWEDTQIPIYDIWFEDWDSMLVGEESLSPMTEEEIEQKRKEALLPK
jgi:hypothetical protein